MQTPKQKAEYYQRNRPARLAYARAYRKANPAKVNKTQANWYLRKQEKEAGRPKPKICEICRRSGRIHFDHNHDTGEFRGWLCGPCNMALGLVGDSPAQLRALALYLERCYHK